MHEPFERMLSDADPVSRAYSQLVPVRNSFRVTAARADYDRFLTLVTRRCLMYKGAQQRRNAEIYYTDRQGVLTLSTSREREKQTRRTTISFVGLGGGETA